ncbi:hypothetical protein F5Y09DRAFT_337786 [Xylaria sp. FL1042]|nr:hypothetical protein F5Y09DRAFT_337786 [Xylaria sp. FL1042]
MDSLLSNPHESVNIIRNANDCDDELRNLDSDDEDEDEDEDKDKDKNKDKSENENNRRVYGELRVLQLRFKHKHAVVDDTCTQSFLSQEIAAVSDCFSTHTLIRTNQAVRDLFRNMTKTPRNMNEPVLPSPIPIASRESNPIPTSMAKSAQAVNTLLPRYPPPLACNDECVDHGETSSSDHEVPNSCQLALTLLLSRYLEILDIFSMTFNMIKTIVNHYPSTVSFSTELVDYSAVPTNMLNTSFSILTATQVTHRLVGIVKKDMRNMWELYQSQVHVIA